MFCPDCAMALDDALEFAADLALQCPGCGRAFTPLEVWLLPLGMPREQCAMPIPMSTDSQIGILQTPLSATLVYI
jgi:hypothetical protein